MGSLDARTRPQPPAERQLAVVPAELRPEPAAGAARAVEREQLTAVDVAHGGQPSRLELLDADGQGAQPRQRHRPRELDRYLGPKALDGPAQKLDTRQLHT